MRIHCRMVFIPSNVSSAFLHRRPGNWFTRDRSTPSTASNMPNHWPSFAMNSRQQSSMGSWFPPTRVWGLKAARKALPDKPTILTGRQRTCQARLSQTGFPNSAMLEIIREHSSVPATYTRRRSANNLCQHLHRTIFRRAAALGIGDDCGSGSGRVTVSPGGR